MRLIGPAMIQLTRINHSMLVLNSDLIEHVEVTPDTVISMTTGQKFRVLETADEVIKKVIEYRKSICEGWMPCPALRSANPPRAGSGVTEEEQPEGEQE
jgi:flagellar protein FlbD